ncbi:MAG: TetR family transcriptional regulator [Bacilli bacterium]|nr:TetR family transcriptional regulator [Bacilli bacterium]
MAKQKITRDELVTRTAKVFRKQGYHNTTMNDIGKICGLLKGSIYHYFQSKEELMVEVLKASYEEACNHVYPIAFDKSISRQKRLSTMLDESSLFSNGTVDGGCLFGRIGSEIGTLFPESNEIIKTHFNAYMEALETIFQEAVSGIQAKELAKQALTEMQGAILLSVIYSDTSYFAEAKQRIMNYVP